MATRMYHPGRPRAVIEVDEGDVARAVAWGYKALAAGQNPPSPSTGGMDVNDPALRAAYVRGPGRGLAVVAGVIRNPGSGWTTIIDSTHQGNANIESVETAAGVVTINYPSLSATKVVSLVATPDETLASRGIRIGTSVTPTLARLHFYQDETITSYVSYNGTTWSSTNTKLTPAFDATTGVLTLTRAAGYISDSAAYYDVNISGRGNVLRPVITNTGGAITATEIRLQFVKADGAVQLTPTGDMKVFLAASIHGAVDPALVTEATAPNSNVWLMGVFETA